MKFVQRLAERRPLLLDGAMGTMLQASGLPAGVSPEEFCMERPDILQVLSRLDVDMVNLHAAGTSEMMRAALEGLTRPDGTRPLLIAVTQLTSTDAAALKNELLIDTPMAETVLSYAKNAAASGLDGVVCSPLEAALVKERCGADFLTVTPGIRFADSAAGDQKRIMTPEKAGKSGCDYIVVGRPITQAEDPVAAYRRAVKDFWG